MAFDILRIVKQEDKLKFIALKLNVGKYYATWKNTLLSENYIKLSEFEYTKSFVMENYLVLLKPS